MVVVSTSIIPAYIFEEYIRKLSKIMIVKTLWGNKNVLLDFLVVSGSLSHCEPKISSRL